MFEEQSCSIEQGSSVYDEAIMDMVLTPCWRLMVQKGSRMGIWSSGFILQNSAGRSSSGLVLGSDLKAGVYSM
jgi:hypothetical protein